MKKKYTKPAIEVIWVGCNHLLTTSSVEKESEVTKHIGAKEINMWDGWNDEE